MFSISIIENKILQFENQLKELVADASGESKSSAGDKHETSRAMMQIEHEKISRQIESLKLVQQHFTRLDEKDDSHAIATGSIIITENINFYMSESIGKIVVDATELMTISPQSPIGLAFKGKSEGDEIVLNGQRYRILKVH